MSYRNSELCDETEAARAAGVVCGTLLLGSLLTLVVLISLLGYEP